MGNRMNDMKKKHARSLAEYDKRSAVAELLRQRAINTTQNCAMDLIDIVDELLQSEQAFQDSAISPNDHKNVVKSIRESFAGLSALLDPFSQKIVKHKAYIERQQK